MLTLRHRLKEPFVGVTSSVACRVLWLVVSEDDEESHMYI